MAIDPDVEVLLNDIRARLDALETEPPIEPDPEPNPEPEPEPIPTPGDAPWEIPILDGETEPRPVRVNVPVGPLGPTTSNSVSPPASIATRSGDLWSMRGDWDEETEGQHLDFGQGRLVLKGHTVKGCTIRLMAGGSGGVTGSGEIANFVLHGPAPSLKALKGDRGTMHAHNGSILGLSGDLMIVGAGGNLVAHDIYCDKLADPASAMHQDGYQGHADSRADLQRIVIDWNHAGSVAGTTAAIFTQMEAGLIADDMLILNPGGTWGIVRVSGSGQHRLGSLQVIGDRRGNVKQPSKLCPKELVWGHRWDTLYNDVPGAADYR